MILKQRNQRYLDIDASELEEVRLLVAIGVGEFQTAKLQTSAEQIDGGRIEPGAVGTEYLISPGDDPG
ncbi:MAG TPA: hypothetical protein EYO84_09160, partial [Planctomycetes bacterium]|nr:hypothetical protein [Planctomycetota bacterium]